MSYSLRNEKGEPSEHCGEAVPSRIEESVEATRSREKARVARAGHVEKMDPARSLRAFLWEMVMRPRVCKLSASETPLGQEPCAPRTLAL